MKKHNVNYSILTQLRSLRRNKLAAFIGILVGATIPVITATLASFATALGFAVLLL